MSLGYSTMSCVVIKVAPCLIHAKYRPVFKLWRVSNKYSFLIPLCFGVETKKKLSSVCIALDLPANFVCGKFMWKK